MAARVRLLPALIGAAGVLMMLRIGAMASSAEQSPTPAQEAEPTSPQASAGEPSGEAQLPAAKGKHSGEATPSAAADTSADSATPETTGPMLGQAQTKGEAEVLQNLSERRAALEARERDVAMREQLMSATEKRVEDRLVELKGLEEKLNAMLAKRDAEEEAQLVALVKTYENMKPGDAAKIFNKLDRTVTLSVAARMKPAKIAAVLAAMEPARAQELTVLLATRMKIAKAMIAPEPAPAAPAPVTAPVPIAPVAADATTPVPPSVQPAASAATPPKT